MSRPGTSRGVLALYWGVGTLFALVLAWWIYFFSQQGDLMLARLDEAGIALDAAQAAAVADAAQSSSNMLLFEGMFLMILFGLGMLLILRSMRDEVRLHRQRRDFLSAVTHELKSPIASARLYLESVMLGRVPEGKQLLYFERVREELDRLGDMTEHLLATARAASAHQNLDLENLDLSAATRSSVDRFARTQSPEVEMEIEAQEALPVRGDPTAIDTILQNLLGNAVKYGGEPARICVRVERDGRHARLTVRDHGPGFPEGDASKLFDPFERGGDELVRSRPGVGLGLYLVAELARAHGGDVTARNARSETGFAVEVRLPIAGDVS